ncbi:glycosyltransferase family 2 protein [Blastococcus sp. CT_GayMR16]|uniref:glycosyltransferase family 2 protein n=1 Tax=Blastococcus sp. CT_GayMR16 TaxID=2559607 RepID=UPI00107394BD|nr:glycosyltransferase family 2 protein [Blastococcus sp. CT_GayMR16]TFV90352.1 glycosyltransferase family 2 protein [Blastococcus sp. CT_GayMR16]
MTRDAVSIIIPHYGSSLLLRRCLNSLVDLQESDEVIVVDNGTGVELSGSRVTLIKNPENRGFAIACNQGAYAASNNLLLFLNNDTRPRDGWLAFLSESISSDSDVAVVGCKLVFPGGEIQHSGSVVSLDERGMLRGYNLTADLPKRYVSAVTAAAMLVRRDAFLDIGGFDEAYWNSHEDVDLCLRLGEVGWKILYDPRAIVQHIESAGGEQRHVGIDAARVRFNERWVGKVTPEPRPVAHPLSLRRKVRNLARRRLRRLVGRL